MLLVVRELRNRTIAVEMNRNTGLISNNNESMLYVLYIFLGQGCK